MFESAETKEQWISDVEAYLIDLRQEILRNPFGILSNENIVSATNRIEQVMAEIRVG